MGPLGNLNLLNPFETPLALPFGQLRRIESVRSDSAIYNTGSVLWLLVHGPS